MSVCSRSTTPVCGRPNAHIKCCNVTDMEDIQVGLRITEHEVLKHTVYKILVRYRRDQGWHGDGTVAVVLSKKVQSTLHREPTLFGLITRRVSLSLPQLVP